MTNNSHTEKLRKIEKRLRKYSNKWYILFLIDILLMGLITTLVTLGIIDLNSQPEFSQILSLSGLTTTSGVFEIKQIYEKYNERKETLKIPANIYKIIEDFKDIIDLDDNDLNDFIEKTIKRLVLVISYFRHKDYDDARTLQIEIVNDIQKELIK